MSSPLILTIFTLNCWGIPWISKDRAIRMEAIASQLATGKYDVVCLQEVWSNDDFDFIREKVKETLPYAHYFHSGVIGSGVCILSKYPIKDTLFHQWSVNGYCHKIQHGDWFGGKGVGLCRIDINGHNVNVYTAHLHAEYDRQNDEYLAHRVVQAFDTAQFIKLTSAPSDLSIIGGDLNTEPEDLAFRIIRNAAGLKDAHNAAPDCGDECNGTNESSRNTYADKNLLQNDPKGKRIDYILYRPPHGAEVTIQQFGLPLPALVPGQSFSYSDHEALSATLKVTFRDAGFSSPARGKDVSPGMSSDLEEALHEGVSICDSALNYLRDQRFNYALCAVVTTVFLIVMHYLLPYFLPAQVNQLLPFLSPVLHILFILFLFFTIFMATIWNCMEVNGILAGKIGMLVTLNKN